MADAREISLSIIGRIADGRADPAQFTPDDFAAPTNPIGFLDLDTQLNSAHKHSYYFVRGVDTRMECPCGQILCKDEIEDIINSTNSLYGIRGNLATIKRGE